MKVSCTEFAVELMKQMKTLLDATTNEKELKTQADPQAWWHSFLMFLQASDSPLAPWAQKELMQLFGGKLSPN